jgi:hypothetical protein
MPDVQGITVTHRDVIARIDVVLLGVAERELVLVLPELLNAARTKIVHVRILHQPRGRVPDDGVHGAVLQKNPVVRVAVVPLRAAQPPQLLHPHPWCDVNQAMPVLVLASAL